MKEGAAASWYVRDLIYQEFKQGKSSVGSMTEWRMREYGIKQPLVLCELYRSP